MVTQAAAQPKTTKNLDKLSYEKLKKLCPDLAKLKENEFFILKAASKTAPDVVIGCIKPESLPKYAGVYEICSQYGDIKIFATVEASHKDKTASALMYETEKGGQKKKVEAQDTRFQDLLNGLSAKGYKQENSQTAAHR